MPSYFPVFLNISGQKCLVVGGGRVAERKICSLLENGADVLVVSPEITPFIKDLVGKRQIAYRQGRYQEDDLCGIFMVIGATEDSSVNEEVSQQAKKQGILCNIVDDPDKCTFIFPAVFKQGDLTVAVSTGGTSPLLAKKIKDKLADQFGVEYARFLEIMQELRPMVKASEEDPIKRYQIFEALINSDLLDLIKTGDEAQVKERIRSCLSLPSE